MGSVFRVRYLDDGSDGAVKFLRFGPLQNMKNRARFLREVQLTSRLQHPNIVTIVDFGRLEHYGPYMVMEYLDGIPLSNLLRNERWLPWPQAIKIAIQVAEAMQFAHENGVVHRDLKPANLFLLRTTSNTSPSVKIVDFGIAQSLEGDLVRMTQTGSLLGTPIYMSPEQVRRMKTNERTDIYTLGIVLFQMLTGFIPFEGKSAMAILMKRLAEPAPKLSKFSSIFAGTLLEHSVARCLMRKPSQRYRSMAELIQDLNCAFQEMTTLSEVGHLPEDSSVDKTAESKQLLQESLESGGGVADTWPTWETDSSPAFAYETQDSLS